MIYFGFLERAWIVLSVVATAALYGQSAAQDNDANDPLYQRKVQDVQAMVPLYNSPAEIRLTGAWDVFTKGSFIYWQPSEDNLELGVDNGKTDVVLTDRGTMVNMPFGFKAGFKVGMGVNLGHDHWALYSEYTWLRSRDHTSFAVTGSNNANSYWIVPARVATLLHAVVATWDLNLDFLETLLQRTYTVGEQMIFTTSFGGRAAWISQKYRADNIRTANLARYQSLQTSHSWGIGPRAGVNADWLVGYGMRFYGKTALDVLYTQYRRHVVVQNPGLAGTLNDVDLHEFGINTLRPHTEIELGLGWGSYFKKNRGHIDLSIGYDFQVFWNQNMFLQFTDLTVVSTVAPRTGGLYLQGLTASARLDF